MTMTKESTLTGDVPRFGDVVPTPEAHAELKWFFNEAEQAMDQPSNFCALLSGISPTGAEEVENRLEAMHAAGKINDRLKKVPTSYALLLAGVYTARVWPAKVEGVLGSLTGAVDSLPTVRAQYLRALIGAQTRAKSVAFWLEELVVMGGPAAVADWRREAELACAIAVGAYENARGTGPSVVPSEES
jgi:hypothetical protein